jgi:hypothetical protein
MKKIRKSIEITAPKESVWAVLLEDAYTKDWMSHFSPGSRPKTDWIEGHKVIFTDNSGMGIVGRIAEKKPYEKLSFTYDGIVVGGEEIYDTDQARAWKGATETYTLTAKDGNTVLDIESDMEDEMFDDMAMRWESALQRISELSHAI